MLCMVRLEVHVVVNSYPLLWSEKKGWGKLSVWNIDYWWLLWYVDYSQFFTFIKKIKTQFFEETNEMDKPQIKLYIHEFENLAK